MIIGVVLLITCVTAVIIAIIININDNLWKKYYLQQLELYQ